MQAMSSTRSRRRVGWDSTRRIALLSSWLGGVACNQDGGLRLKDTEGRQFEAQCKNKSCELTRVDGSDAEKQRAVLSHTGRLVGVCNVHSSGVKPRDFDCRALECSSQKDCPPLYGQEEGDCLNGLCIDPANEFAPADAVMLCLAGTGLGREAPMQVERYALALNCGNPCRIPNPCRQP